MNMKSLIITLLCIVIVFGCSSRNITLKLTSEPSSENHPVAKLLSGDYEKCSQFYHSNTTSVIEVHCDDKSTKNGIYIIDTTGTKYYDWFNKHINTWAWKEGCNDKTSCFYEAVVDSNGKVTELTYTFNINLSEGFYKMTVKDNSLEVTEKKITDFPS